ncbi:MAG: hypothetical protein E7F99_17765 [Bacteroides caccae]|nr:hypothetical protein [Bacteroides caccae]
MDKRRVVDLLERFEKIEEEKSNKSPNIYMVLEITANSYGTFEHYIYVRDTTAKKSFVCSIKGYSSNMAADEVETYDDVLNVLRRVQNG